MNRLLVVPVAATLLIAPVAAAQKPDKGPGAATTISALDAKPNPVVFTAPTELSGRLAGKDSSGAVVRLEADTTRPYGDRYVEVARATSENSGRFAFTVKPAQNTQYRAVAQTSPPVTSGARLVSVRTLVGLVVSDRTPTAGALVRFRGSVFPAKDGRTAVIQRRSSTGRFVTVARTTLQDAGTARSTYSRRLRVRSDGVYRVKVAGDLEHVNGFSRLITIDVG